MMRKIGLCLVLALLTAFPGPPRTKAASSQDQITAILIVDNSGSMEASDPDGLRFTGVRLLASLLDAGDSLGLIVFATESEVITNGIVTLDSQFSFTQLMENFQPPAADGYTNIKAALVAADDLITQADLRHENVVIVLLTDGKPEIPNQYPQYERETLDLARSLEVPIMGIALTSAAQTPFLDQLTAVTKGSLVPANDAADLLNAYLQVLGQIKDRTVMGGEKFKANGLLTIEPSLAPYINLATFVISKPETVRVDLLDSNGREISSDQSNDERYSIFYLEKPAGGDYSFRLQGRGEAQAWAIFRSRLRVQIISPSAFHPLQKDLPIIVNLVEETSDGDSIKIVGDANFTALITSPDGSAASLDRFYDDGTHGDKAAGDGDYTRLYPGQNLEGIYQISIQGWKGVIPVSAETPVKVVKFPGFVVDMPFRENEVRGEDIDLAVHLDTSSSFDQGQIVARITAPSGMVDEILMDGDGMYTGKYPPREDGRYHVVFETRDAKYLGMDYQTSIDHAFDIAIIPSVDISVTHAEVPGTCLASPNKVFLSLSITSSRDENLLVSARDGWEVLPQTVNVGSGEQQIELRLRSINGWNGNTDHVELVVEGSDRLEVQPDAIFGVDIHVPGLYERCRTPIHLGIVATFIVLAGLLSVQHARRSALPPKVGGTLRHWPIGESLQPVAEVDLTILEKNTLLIGNSAACDVMISHAGLEPEQAHLFAEKSAAGIDIFLEPIGEVKKGYGLQKVKFVLQHGDTFRMGTHEFQYLSDHGE